MANNGSNEFNEGIIYTITNYIYWFFMGNLYFMLLNIPMVLLFLISLDSNFAATPESTAFMTFICCIPVGPAATALFSVMGKLIREKDLSITKDFFKAYKSNFKQSLFFWIIESLLLFILFIDIRFFTNQHITFLNLFFMFVMLLIFLVGLYVLPILSRFYMRSKDIVKLSIYYSLKKLPNTIVNLAIIISAGFLLFKFSGIIIVFISSIVCFLIMYNEQKLLKEIQEKFTPNTEN